MNKQTTSEDKKRTTDGQVLKTNQTNLWRQSPEVQKTTTEEGNYRWRNNWWPTTGELTTHQKLALVIRSCKELKNNFWRFTHQKFYQDIRSFRFSEVSFISCCLYKAAVVSTLLVCLLSLYLFMYLVHLRVGGNSQVCIL